MSESWPDDPGAFMTAYMDAWNQGDVDRVCDAYHVPALIHKRGRVQANMDAASRQAYLRAYLDSTRNELAAGTRWECPSCAFTPLGRDGVLATAHWVFRQRDGTILEDYLDSYVLVGIDGRWVFLADVVHDAD